MTALALAEHLHLHAEPVITAKRGTPPKASLMLMLRALSDAELADLEDEIVVYTNTGVVCQRLANFIDE